MEHLELFISLAGTVLSLLITSIAFITKFLKSSKAKNVAENILEICNALLPLISKAEKLTNYTGKEKKEYVLTLIRQYALDNHLSFDYQKISDGASPYHLRSTTIAPSLSIKIKIHCNSNAH